MNDAEVTHVTESGVGLLVSAGCGTQLTFLSLKVEAIRFFGPFSLDHFSDLELFASHFSVLDSLGDLRYSGCMKFLRKYVHSEFVPLLTPPSVHEFKHTLTSALPEHLWRLVLGYTDVEEYTTLTRRSRGVSREFYFRLKSSLVLIRLPAMPLPLLGLVWLHSREPDCARVKCLEVAFPIKADELLSLCKTYRCFRSSTVRILPSRFHWYHDGVLKSEALSNLEALMEQGLVVEWVQD